MSQHSTYLCNGNKCTKAGLNRLHQGNKKLSLIFTVLWIRGKISQGTVLIKIQQHSLMCLSAGISWCNYKDPKDRNRHSRTHTNGPQWASELTVERSQYTSRGRNCPLTPVLAHFMKRLNTQMNVEEVVQPKTFGHYLLTLVSFQTLMSYEFLYSVEHKRKGFKKWKNIFVHTLL